MLRLIIFLLIIIIGLFSALIILNQEKLHKKFNKSDLIVIGISLFFSLIMLIFIFFSSKDIHSKKENYLPAHFNNNGALVEAETEKD